MYKKQDNAKKNQKINEKRPSFRQTLINFLYAGQQKYNLLRTFFFSLFIPF